MMAANMLTRIAVWPIALALGGCMDSSVRETEQWMKSQREAMLQPSLPQIPDVADTPPAQYNSTASDPFSAARLNVRKTVPADREGVIFPDVPLSALVLKGYLLSEHGIPVGMVVYENQYRSIRIGDRLSDSSALVKNIGQRGALLVLDGAQDQWLPISKP